MLTSMIITVIILVLTFIVSLSPIKKKESKEEREGRETYLLVSSIFILVLSISTIATISDSIFLEGTVKPPLSDRQLEYNCVLTSIEKYNKSFDQASEDCKKLIKLYNEVK